MQAWWDALSNRPTRDANIGSDKSRPVAATQAPAGTSGPVAAGNESSIAATPQRLHLISTSPGRNLREGVASIGTDPQNPQTYVAGAILVNGARLAEIHSNRVVLERSKEKVSLFLASAPGSASDGPAQASLDLTTVPALSSSKPAPLEVLGVDRLGEVIRAMPYYENEILQGLQVAPGRQSGTFARLGLKPADVIVAIDSVAVTDAQNALEYLQALTQGAAVSVRVRRDGSTHTLSLDGTLIEAANTRTSTLTQPAPPDLGRTSQ